MPAGGERSASSVSFLARMITATRESITLDAYVRVHSTVSELREA
jgi:hypothetical protein